MAEARELARERLRNFTNLTREEDIITEEICRLMMEMQPAGFAQGAMSGGGAHGRTPTLVQLERFQELKARLIQMRERVATEKVAIMNVIMAMEDSRHRSLLMKKYIQGCTLEQIAAEWPKSFEQVKRWHRLALDEFGTLLH